MSDDYQPIDCGLYSEYELAIMHHTPLQLAWRDEAGGSHIGTLVPLDLQTRNHVEYLTAREGDGNEVAIRLDRIDRMEKND